MQPAVPHNSLSVCKNKYYNSTNTGDPYSAICTCLCLCLYMYMYFMTGANYKFYAVKIFPQILQITCNNRFIYICIIYNRLSSSHHLEQTTKYEVQLHVQMYISLASTDWQHTDWHAWIILRYMYIYQSLWMWAMCTSVELRIDLRMDFICKMSHMMISVRQ